MIKNIIACILMVILVAFPIVASEVVFLGSREPEQNMSPEKKYSSEEFTRREEIRLPRHINREFHILRHLEIIERILFIQELQQILGDGKIDPRLTYELMCSEIEVLGSEHKQIRHLLIEDVRKGRLK